MNTVVLVNKKEYSELLEDWFAFKLLEVVETLPKVLKDPKKAQQDMNSLKRHSKFNLTEAIVLLEGEQA